MIESPVSQVKALYLLPLLLAEASVFYCRFAVTDGDGRGPIQRVNILHLNSYVSAGTTAKLDR